MIPYEELEKALARWKARRAGAEAQESAVPDGVPIAMSASSIVYEQRDSTGEVDLNDVVDHSDDN